LAKKRLAFLGKDFSHFLAFDFLNEPVEIDKTALQSLGEIPSHGAFANGHKTDERDVLLRSFRQRISNS
jgi:hypothetical protein